MVGEINQIHDTLGSYICFELNNYAMCGTLTSSVQVESQCQRVR